MHIEFLVEEMSAQVALQNILVKIFVGYNITFDIHPYQGKLDLITGGTWEALERLLQKAGDHQGGLEKNKAARAISQFMEPESNRYQSFQAFYQGILTMVEL